MDKTLDRWVEGNKARLDQWVVELEGVVEGVEGLDHPPPPGPCGGPDVETDVERPSDEEQKAWLDKISESVFQRMRRGQPQRRERPVAPAQQSIPFPIPVPIGQQAPHAAPAKKPVDAAKIIIKQTVKQQVGKLRARKKATNTVAQLRKKYNKLKKERTRAFRKQKSSDYKKQSRTLKGTKTEKSKKRKNIKDALQKKLKAVLSKMKTASKKDSKELDLMINELKRLKW